MWEFITANAQSLGVLVTGVTLGVWTVYGQLLAANAKRARTPRVFLKQVSGRDLDAAALLSNMGHESIYVRAVFLKIKTDDGSYEGAVEAANNEVAEDANGQDIKTCQGPLPPSGQMHLGTFESLIAEASGYAGRSFDTDAPFAESGIRAFDVTAVASHGADERIIGARRRFVVDDNGEILSSGADTDLLRGRHARPLRERLERLTQGQPLADS